MKQLTYILFIISFTLAYTSCIEDEGNYVYEDLVRLSVDSVKESYQVNTMIDHLVIKPEIMGSGDYNCLWMLYPAQIVNPTIDTISNEQELDYLVTENAGDYFLILQVEDKQTGDAAFVQSTINIATLYSNGWYVLKEIEGVTDMDMITPNMQDKAEDLFLNTYGERMPGIPIDLSYTPAYTYIDNDNVKKYNIPVLWICSEDDVYMLNATSMNLIFRHDELFYGDIPTEIPYHVCFGPSKSYYVYMSSLGIYWFHGATPSSGKSLSPEIPPGNGCRTATATRPPMNSLSRWHWPSPNCTWIKSAAASAAYTAADLPVSSPHSFRKTKRQDTPNTSTRRWEMAPLM